MMDVNEFTQTLAISLLRIVTGILFFFQGFDKIFNVKIKNVVQTFEESISRSWIPNAFLKPFAWITSIAEMLGGLLLIFGLFREAALMILSIDMIMVAFAFSSVKAMWDMQHYFPRFIFLFILLWIPGSEDLWSLDSFLR